MALTAAGKCCLPQSLTCGFTSVLFLTASLAVETATQKGSCEEPEQQTKQKRTLNML